MGFVWWNPKTDLLPLGLAFLLSSSLVHSSSADGLPLPHRHTHSCARALLSGKFLVGWLGSGSHQLMRVSHAVETGSWELCQLGRCPKSSLPKWKAWPGKRVQKLSREGISSP